MVAIPLLSRALFVAEDNRGCAFLMMILMLQEGGVMISTDHHNTFVRCNLIKLYNT